MASDIWNISDMDKICMVTTNPPPPLLESFASNQPFIFKNQQNIKQWDKRNILWEIEMKEKNSWVAKKIFQNLSFFWYPFII